MEIIGDTILKEKVENKSKLLLDREYINWNDIYYTNVANENTHLQIRSGEADNGIIMRYDYSHEPRRYEFAKYNFGESERFEYYNLEKSDIDMFHNIIFNHECI